MQPIGGKHWLVTINTYGTWLPGDPRGFQTRHGREHVPPPTRFAKPGEPTYNASEYEGLYQHARRISGDAMLFDSPMQQRVLACLVEHVAQLDIVPRVLSLGSWHAHLVAQFGRLKIRKTMGWLKGRATNMLRREGWTRSVWAGGCDRRSKASPEALRNAIQYVRDHAKKGALVYEWC